LQRYRKGVARGVEGGAETGVERSVEKRVEGGAQRGVEGARRHYRPMRTAYMYVWEEQSNESIISDYHLTCSRST